MYLVRLGSDTAFLYNGNDDKINNVRRIVAMISFGLQREWSRYQKWRLSILMNTSKGRPTSRRYKSSNDRGIWKWSQKKENPAISLTSKCSALWKSCTDCTDFRYQFLLDCLPRLAYHLRVKNRHLVCNSTACVVLIPKLFTNGELQTKYNNLIYTALLLAVVRISFRSHLHHLTVTATTIT